MGGKNYFDLVLTFVTLQWIGLLIEVTYSCRQKADSSVCEALSVIKSIFSECLKVGGLVLKFFIKQ